MKNKVLKLVLLFSIAIVALSSCTKEPMPSDAYAVDPIGVDEGPTIDRWGMFLVIDAVMYIDNLETGEKTVFNHFSSIKSRSSLRWGGSMYDIEVIIKDTTTYSFYEPINFPGIGNFVLNGDTSKHYGVNYIGSYNTIIEDPVYGVTQPLMGGSSRPYSAQVWDYNSSTIAMQIQEEVGSINGQNVRYWTQLKLKKIVSW